MKTAFIIKMTWKKSSQKGYLKIEKTLKSEDHIENEDAIKNKNDLRNEKKL